MALLADIFCDFVPPKLDDLVSEVHPIPWREYLERLPFRERNGVRQYTEENDHYIVKDGEVRTFFGFHGDNAFESLSS